MCLPTSPYTGDCRCLVRHTPNRTSTRPLLCSAHLFLCVVEYHYRPTRVAYREPCPIKQIEGVKYSRKDNNNNNNKTKPLPLTQVLLCRGSLKKKRKSRLAHASLVSHASPSLLLDEPPLLPRPRLGKPCWRYQRRMPIKIMTRKRMMMMTAMAMLRCMVGGWWM